MLLKITFIKIYLLDSEEKRDSVKTPKTIVNNFISIIKTGWIVLLKCVLNSHLINNCRKHRRFNLRDWWIMHLHHIGFPPATNRYSKLSVSGNYLILTKLI